MTYSRNSSNANKTIVSSRDSLRSELQKTRTSETGWRFVHLFLTHLKNDCNYGTCKNEN